MPNRPTFLLHPVGSAGDVYPFIGLGQALKARGHNVTILTSGYFKDTVERAGLDFVDTLPKEDFLQLAGNPLLWHRVWGAGTLLRSMTPELIRNCYRQIEKRYKPGQTVLLTPCIGFGGRLAHERLGIPLVTVALQPALLWSNHNGPVLDGISNWAPTWLKRFQYFLAEKFLVGPNILPAINGFRKELGLRNISGISNWWLSPQSVLCLFPEWFAPRQPDWPSHVHYSQFPLFNEDESEALPSDVQQFLSDGDPPIVFAPGSANMFGKEFFKVAAESCDQSGRRGMLFSKFDDPVPSSLPNGVQHFRYAPFKKLLPQCAAIAHHGGIGTMANAMAAGIPQLIKPFTYDQPDNGARVTRLALGGVLNSRAFTRDRVSSKFRDLLDSADINESCRAISKRIQSADPFEEACKVAESLIGKDI